MKSKHIDYSRLTLCFHRLNPMFLTHKNYTYAMSLSNRQRKNR